MDIDKIKRIHFIEPDLKVIGYAYHTVRIELLKAINELKDCIEGDVIDLGCGIMPYKEYLLTNSIKKITSYKGIDWASDYHNLIVPDYIWDGKTIPIQSNSVDWVIATEFLEHYYDTSAILKEINRILKPNGVLFFTVPFIWSLHEIPYDEYRFTPFSLQKKLNETGFSNNEIKPIGGYNHSLAIMIGLWLQYSGIGRFKRKILSILFKPFYKKLIANDKVQYPFDNHQMYSGLMGFATKNSSLI
jgi:SAM-dependent methyltransferase